MVEYLTIGVKDMIKLDSLEDVKNYISIGVYQQTLITRTPYVRCETLEHAEKEFNRGISLYVRSDSIIQEAKNQGIIDIDVVTGTPSIEIIKLASDLMKKHGADIYKRLEERRREQNG